jgi:hypothetical protein
VKPRSNVRRPHGYLRASQAVTTFGPGAMMDLPQHGVLVAGLELWGDPVTQDFRRVAEPRLARRLAEMFGRPIDLYTPPEVVTDGKNQTRVVRHDPLGRPGPRRAEGAFAPPRALAHAPTRQVPARA